MKQDPDFCSYYKGINPLFYTIWVCPECGYAADERYFTSIRPKIREKIKQFLENRKVNIPYKEIRTFEEAVNAFKLAIFFAEYIDEPQSRRAGLYIKLAWIYRQAEDRENENKLLQKAVDAYDKSLTTERYPIGQMTDAMVMYLIGVLSWRLGDQGRATQYLSRVIGDQTVRTSQRKLFEMARDLWQSIRSNETGEKTK